MEPKQEITVRIPLPADADLSNPPYCLFDSIDLDAHLADEFGEDRSDEARWLREADETRREANYRPGQE